MTCCVRRAICTAFSVGSASASSMEFVWRDCVPPRTAASAWMAGRVMLFSGCCAVSVEPGLDVGDGVGEGEGDFLDGGAAGLAHVVAADADGVPGGDVVLAPGEE